MKIGPVDIRNHNFTKRMRGVDESEVRDYLDLVADRLEESIIESDELRMRIDRLEAEVGEFRKLERTLRDSLLSAERLVDDRAGQAEKEAQITIRNAEVQAEKILVDSRGELSRIRAEFDDLRRQKTTYVERLRALMRSQMKILEASLESFDPDRETAGAGMPARAASSGVVPRPGSGPYRTSDPVPEALTSYVGREGLFPGGSGGGEDA